VFPPKEPSDGDRPDAQTTLELIVAALPEMAKYLASVPDAQKGAALAALENHYFRTVTELGYSEEPARAWVAVLIAHLQEQLEEISEHPSPTAVGAAPKRNFGLADKLLTRIISAVVLTVASPLIGVIWIGAKLQHSGPAIELRKAEYGRPQIYSFVLGPGRVSRFLRRVNLQSLPSLWHLLNGDTVLRVRDLARIAQFPSSSPPPN
jgi:hypothetical protein